MKQLLWIPALLALTASGGCTFTTAHFAEVHLAKALKGDGSPAVKATGFTKADSMFICTVKMMNTPSDTRVKGVWHYIGEGDARQAIDSAEVTLDSDRWVYFTLTPSGAGLPYGKYEIDLTIDGANRKTVPFEMRPAIAHGPISEAVLSRSVNDAYGPLACTSSFRSTDTVLYAPVYLNDPRPGTTVTASWYKSDARGRQEIVRTAVPYEQKGWIAFSMKPSMPLPSGSYGVDILLNGSLVTSLPFSVD